jgi:hypothetical protein
MNYLVYAIAVLLVISVALFVKVVFFDKRPQKIGLLFILLAVPLYLVYYNDRWPTFWGKLNMRALATPLQNYTPQADVNFISDIAPAGIVGLILLIHLTVLQRVAVRRRLQRIHDPIATFFAGSVAATLVGGTLVSTFHWGWIGAVSIAGGFALIYLGALALLAAIVELMAALAKYFGVWIKRKVFAVATMITRAASWISSLGGRLVSRSLLEKIREDTALQEARFVNEQDEQDRRLEDGYVRDRNRRRAARERARLKERKSDRDDLDMLAIDPPAAPPRAELGPAPQPSSVVDAVIVEEAVIVIEQAVVVAPEPVAEASVNGSAVSESTPQSSLP